MVLGTSRRWHNQTAKEVIMRIIAGSLKGQTYTNLSIVTHPMSEKIRGGLFNILGDISDLTLLDCFAGTGSISFEAISRGAKSSIAVDSNIKAQQSIAGNIKKLGVERQVKLIKSSVGTFIENYKNQSFDLIVCDPPFDMPIDLDTISRLEKMLNQNGLFILSLPVDSTNPVFHNLELIKEKKYGDARLVFFR